MSQDFLRKQIGVIAFKILDLKYTLKLKNTLKNTGKHLFIYLF